MKMTAVLYILSMVLDPLWPVLEKAVHDTSNTFDDIGLRMLKALVGKHE